jgi:hypothetical protein
MIKLKEKALGQPTQDNHDHMVNKLESETTITRSFSQQKYMSPHDKRQGKVKKDLKHIKCYDIGHYGLVFFPPARYRVVKITRSCSEVVLRTTNHTMVYCHTPVLKSTEPKPPYVCPGCLITHIATI